MKNIFFLCLLMALSNINLAQNILIEDRDTLDYLVIQDIDTFHQVKINYYAPRKKKERNRIIFLNRIHLDSSGIHFENDLHYYDGVFHGNQFDYEDKYYRVYSLDINRGIVEKLIESRKFIPRSFHFGNNESNQLLELDESGKTIVFADLDPHLDYIEPYRATEKIRKIFELTNDKIVGESCAWGGGCTLYRYFIIEKDSVKEIDFDQLRQPYKNQFDRQYEDFRVNFYFSHYDYDFLMAGVDYGNLPEQTDLIFSKDLEDTAHIIKKQQPWEIIGENIQEGKNRFFYLRSRLDNGEKVIVSYKVDRAFEEVAYDIFKNHSIDKNQIKDFNEGQLGVLKNLVFAKYNYAFSTDFYQAYFNLFEFYNDETRRTSRTKNMNGLLTEADTKNLEMINETLKKYD